jgi:hypothetical protein
VFFLLLAMFSPDLGLIQIGRIPDSQEFRHHSGTVWVKTDGTLLVKMPGTPLVKTPGTLLVKVGGTL